MEPVDHLEVGDPQGRAPPVDGWQQVREAIAKRSLQVPSACVGEQGRTGPGEATAREARRCSCPRSPLRGIEPRRQVVGVVVENDRPGRSEVLLLVDLDESSGSVGVGEDSVDGPTLSWRHRFWQVATSERRVDLLHEGPPRAAVVSRGSEQPSGSRTGCDLTVGYLGDKRDGTSLDLQCDGIMPPVGVPSTAPRRGVGAG